MGNKSGQGYIGIFLVLFACPTLLQIRYLTNGNMISNYKMIEPYNDTLKRLKEIHLLIQSHLFSTVKNNFQLNVILHTDMSDTEKLLKR